MQPREKEVGIYFPKRFQKKTGMFDGPFLVEGAMQVQQVPFYSGSKLLIAIEFESVEKKEAFLEDFDVPRGVKLVK